MITIWKYEIFPLDRVQEFKLPKGAEILSFGLDGEDKLCFWALVSTEARLKKTRLWCVGTGWPLTDLGMNAVEYVGTVTHGVYVWHMFKEVEDETNSCICK